MVDSALGAGRDAWSSAFHRLGLGRGRRRKRREIREGESVLTEIGLVGNRNPICFQ